MGAYTGSLAGAVNKLGDKPPALEIPARPAGVRLAAHVLSPAHREHVSRHFIATTRARSRKPREPGATGSWADFDPVSAPKWLEEPTQYNLRGLQMHKKAVTPARSFTM